MLDRFGAPAHNAGDDGAFVPDGPDGCHDADTELIRRTAAWLRADGDGARAAGLAGDKDVRAMTALLDMLATELASMSPSVRRATVDWCRTALRAAPGSGRNGY